MNKKIAAYLIVFLSISAITVWVVKNQYFNSSELNFDINASQPIIIPYPNGVILDKVKSIKLASTQENTIWINGNFDLEIDLINRKSTLFTQKYELDKHFPYIKYWEKEIDEKTNDLWFSYNHVCNRYNLITKKLDTYDDIGIILCHLRDDNQLWMGTTKGLFKFDDNQESMLTIDAVCNFAVNSIENEGKKLIINKVYSYDKTKNIIENLPNELVNKKVEISESKEISTENYTWYFFENTFFCQSKKDNKAYQVYNFGKENILKIQQFGDKILVFGQYKMIIATEQTWFSLKNDIKPKTYFVEKQAIDLLNQEILDSLKGENLTILQKIEKIENVKLKYKNHTDSTIQFVLKDLSSYLYANWEEIKLTLDSNLDIPNNYKCYLYKNLIKELTLLGRITQASDYHRKMKKENFEQIDEDFEKNIFYVHRGRAKMDSIKQFQISEDALLWAKANVIEDVLHGVDWNDDSYGDNWGNFTASNELYQELYTKYPKSEYAEEAEWRINGNCLDADTCSPPNGSYECINFCKDFLRRYPNSKFKKEVLECIIENYCYLGGEMNDNINEIKEGIMFTEKAYRDFPLLGDIKKDAFYQSMKENLSLLSWELKASINKQKYKEGEDIILNVVLLRNSTAKESGDIQYNSNALNCYVELELNKYSGAKEYNCKEYFRENLSCPDVRYTRKIIKPGQSISEQSNLLKRVRHSDFRKEGLFLLPKGFYKMTVYWHDLAKSEVIKFEIE